MYSTILFDFFGVFCTPLSSNWFKKTAFADAAGLTAFQALCTRSDLGQLSRAGFYAEVSKLTGIPVTEIEKGIEAEKALDHELVAYAKELKNRGYRIACLSNGSHEWTLQVINDYDLGQLFEEVVLSSDVGIVKPDPAIYEYTLKKLKITAGQAIFVDDRQANVDAGEACGIKSLLFTNTESFVKDLEAVLKKEDLCESANGKRVVFDPVNSHTATHFNDTPQLRELVVSALHKKDLIGKVVAEDIDMSKIIGSSDVVETDDTDDVVYAMRKNREEQGYVPFTKSRTAQPCSFISIHLEQKNDDTYELMSAWIGEYDSPSFPQMSNATADSIPYWTKHAFVWGSQEVIPGTELSSCPW